MCGIAGSFSFSGERTSPDVIGSMLAALAHRGPDGEGTHAEGPVALGHRRLAIIDTSAAGAQPMQSADGRWTITFNGEIYNYRDLQAELGLADADLQSRSDTEILLAAWQRWGPETLPRLVGQFAFGIYDARHQRLYLARDRFGEKPLFYHRDDRRLTFASSIGALLTAPWIHGEIDPAALVEYVTLRYVVGPRTILAGIHKLPGGHLLTVDADGQRSQSWYRPRFRPTAHGRSRGELLEEFGHLLSQAARRCLVSDVPVALLLSDGLDSNSILAAVHREGADIDAFTYRLSDTRSALETRADDRASGATFMDLFVSQDERLARMREVYASFTEPVGDGASLATWFLIRGARDRATVFLCGHGGDEILGGYRLSQDRFRLAAMRLGAWLPLRLNAFAFARYAYGSEPVRERRRRFRQARRAHVGAAARYLIHQPLPLEQVTELFATEALPAPYLESLDDLYARCPDPSADLDQMQEVMIRTFLSENILTFADSVAMSSSAELRMPFLDRDLVEFVFSLGPRWRVSRWPGRMNTKLVLREWSRGVLPERIVDGRKESFNYGSMCELMATHRSGVTDLVLGSPAVTRALPGLERWLDHPAHMFRSSREQILWAILTLSCWCEGVGVR